MLSLSSESDQTMVVIPSLYISPCQRLLAWTKKAASDIDVSMTPANGLVCGVFNDQEKAPDTFLIAVMLDPI